MNPLVKVNRDAVRIGFATVCLIRGRAFTFSFVSALSYQKPVR